LIRRSFARKRFGWGVFDVQSSSSASGGAGMLGLLLLQDSRRDAR